MLKLPAAVRRALACAGPVLAGPVLGALALAPLAPIQADAATIVTFVGADRAGGLVSGTATVASEGFAVPVIAFSATFSNLAQEGFLSDTYTFDDPSQIFGYFFTASNSLGFGRVTFAFDSFPFGQIPTRGTYAYTCLLDCVGLVETATGTSALFFTEVTSFTTVPEPLSGTLLGAGLLGLAGLGRRARPAD